MRPSQTAACVEAGGGGASGGGGAGTAWLPALPRPIAHRHWSRGLHPDARYATRSSFVSRCVVGSAALAATTGARRCRRGG